MNIFVFDARVKSKMNSISFFEYRFNKTIYQQGYYLGIKDVSYKEKSPVEPEMQLIICISPNMQNQIASTLHIKQLQRHWKDLNFDYFPS